MARDEEERGRVDFLDDGFRCVGRVRRGIRVLGLDDDPLIGNILAQPFEEQLEHCMNLHRQLPRRHDDQRKHLIPPQTLLRRFPIPSAFPRELLFPPDEPLQDGNDVAQRLARARDGFHEEILVLGDGERDEGCLNWREVCESECGVDS